MKDVQKLSAEQLLKQFEDAVTDRSVASGGCHAEPSGASLRAELLRRLELGKEVKGLRRFETLDLILPSICEKWSKDGVFAFVQLTDTHIELQVGGRDIRWSRETARVTDTGFFVNPEQAEQV